MPIFLLRKIWNIFLGKSSILKKFLLINFVFFSVISLFTLIYLFRIEPSLVKEKSVNHIKIVNNTINHIDRLNIDFEKKEISKFILSTKFLFQNIDRVQFFDENFELIGDTDTLDLDPRFFSRSFEITEFELGSIDEEEIIEKKILKKKKEKNYPKFVEILKNYKNSKNYGAFLTISEEINNNFNVLTVKNVFLNQKNTGYILISEFSNEIKIAIEERRNFILRTILVVAVVILIFSFVLNRYFLKPIKVLVDYTKAIKEKDIKTNLLDKYLKRRDELGQLSKSLNEMTQNLYKRINVAETFSTDLTHEIRNPLASLKGASDLIDSTKDDIKRSKLIKIISHDVERIDRLITDYSQMLKDEAALSREKMKKIDLVSVVKSVVEDYNSLSSTKKNIKIKLNSGVENSKIYILGLENRIEQVLANLFDNSISFGSNGNQIKVMINVEKNLVKLILEDEGPGFNEKNIEKIFNRFYSNRPEKFGQHTGLGLNIVKNIVELHDGYIVASNKISGKGAKIEISLPKYS